MSSKIGFVLCFVGVFLYTNAQPTDNNLFDEFLKRAIYNFSNWLRETDFEPKIKEYDLYANSSILNLTLKIKDEQVENYANPSNEWTVHHTDSEENNIYLIYENTGVITLKGNYEANGTILNEDFISTAGTWSYTAYSGFLELTHIANFSINSDGYVDISNSNFQHWVDNQFVDPLSHECIDFRKLLTIEHGGFQDHIFEELLEAFRSQRFILGDTPVTGVLLQRYLTEVFQKTPYSEIINPPTISTTYPTFPSCPPCKCETESVLFNLRLAENWKK